MTPPPALLWRLLLLLSAVSAAEIRLGFLYIQSDSSWCQESFSQFKLALSEVNADPGILPNHTLTFVTADTQGSESHALRGAVDLISRHRVHAVVGTGYSSALESPATYCSIFKVPIVSPGSTAIQLTNKQRYPYLLRTAPNSVNALKAMAVTVYELGWRKAVCLAHVDHSQNAFQMLHPSLKALDIEYLALSYGPLDTAAGLQDLNNTLALINRTGFRVVLLLGQTVDAILLDSLTKAFGLRGEMYSWVLLQTAFGYPWTVSKQVITVQPFHDDASPVRTAFFSRWPNVTTVYNQSIHGPWDPVTKMPFYGNNTYSSVIWDTDYAPVGDGQPDSWGMIVYDTVWVMAKAFHALLKAGGDPTDGALFRQNILATDHLGVTGRLRFDRSTQDISVQMMVIMANGTEPHALVGRTTSLLGAGSPGDGGWCRTGCLDATAAQLAALPWYDGRMPSDGRALDTSNSEATVDDELMDGTRITILLSFHDSFRRPPCSDLCAFAENSTCQACQQDLAAYHLLTLEARTADKQLVEPAVPLPPPQVDLFTGRGTLLLRYGFSGAGSEDRQLWLTLRHRGSIVPFSSKSGKMITLVSTACRLGSAGDTGLCFQCSAGSIAPRRGQLRCTVCGLGTFQDLVGQTACKECPVGRFAGTGALSECLPCPFGRFQNETGRDRCEMCPLPMVTFVPGSSALSSCVCPTGTYAPAGAKLVPGQALGPCRKCPPGMRCETGSDVRNFPGSNPKDWPMELEFGIIVKKPYPVVLPNHWSSGAAPLSVYKCLEGPKQCPGGPPDACGPRMFGNLCWVCEPSFYRSGDGCVLCPSMNLSKAILFVLPLLLCVTIPLYYRLSVGLHGNVSWNQPLNSVRSLLALALAELQAAGILLSCNLELTPGTGHVWPHVNDILGLLRMECAGVGSFIAHITLRLLLPALCGLAFIGIGGLSRILGGFANHFRMDSDLLFGCFGSAFVTFYISMCAMSCSLFKCYDHPNGEQSMRSAPQILCYHEEWNQMVVLSTVALLFYCVGSLALFAWVLHRAPSYRSESGFCKRWHFLLAKYRPNCRWWTILWLMKGVLLNLAQVVATSGQDQLIILQMILVVYLVATVYYRPWRHVDVNLVDSIVHLALTLICGMLHWYTLAHGGQGGQKYLVDIAITTPLVIAGLCLLSRAFVEVSSYYMKRQEGRAGKPESQAPAPRVRLASSQSTLSNAVNMARGFSSVHTVARNNGRHSQQVHDCSVAFGLSPSEAQHIWEAHSEQDRCILIAASKLLMELGVEERRTSSTRLSEAFAESDPTAPGSRTLDEDDHEPTRQSAEETFCI